MSHLHYFSYCISLRELPLSESPDRIIYITISFVPDRVIEKSSITGPGKAIQPELQTTFTL